MPRKRIYAADPAAKDRTAAARNRALRLRKAGHAESLCPVCSERFGRQVGCPFFSGATIAAAAKEEAARVRHSADIRKLLAYDLIAAFVKVTGIPTDDFRYETLKTAWKKHAAEIHPDRGGDTLQSAMFNVLWLQIKKKRGWK